MKALGAVIRGHDFKRWRKGLNLSQKEAAEALGLKRRVVQYYEKGERDGKSIEIPKTVRLACYAVSRGVSEYEGPDAAQAEKGKRRAKSKDEEAKKAKSKESRDKPKKQKKKSKKD